MSQIQEQTEGYTMKQACEHIVKANFLEKKDGTAPTAEEIHNVSPTGELWQVFEWFDIACKLIGKPTI